MLILAGVVISLTIGENGLINTSKYTVQKNSEESAREKLELALADLTSHKYTDENYNESEYINSYLKNEGMQVIENVVIVDGWRFTIDRSVPQIGESLGQEEIRVIKIVREYLGKNENGKYVADVTIIIESDKAIKNIVFQEQDGTPIEVVPTTEKYRIAKDMIIELDKEYKIVINTDDGKSEERTIIEKLPELGILISTPYVGTSSFTTKVQYVTNEEEVESYTYMLNEEEVNTSANTEYILENQLEPETTYNIKVIAKYKNGLTVESNVVTIKTQPRTYLYNNGDECIDITDGWEEKKISTNYYYRLGNNPQWFDGNGKYSSGTYKKNVNNIAMSTSHPGTSWYGQTIVSMVSKKTIDLSKYKKLKVDAELKTNYNSIWNVLGENGKKTGITVNNNISTMENEHVDISISSTYTGGTTGTLTVKSVWLEK